MAHSSSDQTSHVETARHSSDVAESVVPHVHVVLPAAGAVLMLLLAFIAVFMA